MVMGRQKLKKTFQYEIKWRGLDHRYNSWVPRDELIQKGFAKLVAQFDDLESSREGAGARETRADIVRKHLEDIGLDGDIAQYNEIAGLSGGQKIKLVIAACLWNNPQICVLDEPSNFLDREALGGLAVAIRDWAGAVVRNTSSQRLLYAHILTCDPAGYHLAQRRVRERVVCVDMPSSSSRRNITDHIYL